MKALSLIALVFAACLIYIGVSSRAAGNVLGNAVIVAGALVAVFIAVVQAIIFIKEKRGK